MSKIRINDPDLTIDQLKSLKFVGHDLAMRIWDRKTELLGQPFTQHEFTRLNLPKAKAIMEQISFGDTPPSAKPKTSRHSVPHDDVAGATANLTESFEYAAAQDAREAQANQVQFLSNQMKTLTETCRKMEGTLRHQGTLLEEKDREIENLRRQSAYRGPPGFQTPPPDHYLPTYQDQRQQGYQPDMQYNLPPPQLHDNARNNGGRRNFAATTPNTPGNAMQTPRMSVKLKVYDGTTNWEAYFKQFQLYSARQGWGPEEQKEYLFLHLSGAALDYYYSMCMDIDNIAAISDTMNWRFGKKELPTTLRSTFESMRQTVDESLDQWAERVRSTALGAFVGLPVQYQQSEIVRKFCHGLADKDAATQSAVRGCRSLEDALQFVRNYSEVTKSVYGSKRVRRMVREAEDTDESSDDEYSVRQLRKQNFKHSYNKPSHGSYQSKPSSPSPASSKLEEKLDATLSAMQNITKLLEVQMKRDRSRSPRRSDSGELICYHCEQPGHIKTKCPLLNKEKDSKKSVSFESENDA